MYASDNDSLLTITPCQGESEHRRVKRQYQRVHKGKFACGIATQQHQERRLLQMREAAPKNDSISSRKRKDYPSEDDEPHPHIQPQEHHSISPSILHKIRLSMWLGENQDDPVLKVGVYYRSNSQF